MNKTNQDVWKNSNWTQQARAIIEGVNKFPQDAIIFLFIRHSHRKSSYDATALEKLGTTELGCEIARIFGSHLSNFRHLTAYHSSSPRCIETTYNICKGFQAVGGNYDICGINHLMNKLKSSSKFITIQALKYIGIEFIKRWQNNEFSNKDIIPFNEYCMNVYEYCKKISKNSQEGEIFLHVTHDIFIMALRYGWFGGVIKNIWPSFLGGFGFSFYISTSFFLDVGKHIPCSIKICNGKNIQLFIPNHKKGGDKYG